MDDLEDMADGLPLNSDNDHATSSPWDTPAILAPLKFKKRATSFANPRYAKGFGVLHSRSRSSPSTQNSQSSLQQPCQQKRGSSQELLSGSPAFKRVKQADFEPTIKTENTENVNDHTKDKGHTQIPVESPSDPVAGLRSLADRMAGYAPMQAKRVRVLAKLRANQVAFSAEIKGFALAHQRRLDQQVQRAELHRRELEQDGDHAEAEVRGLLEVENRTRHRRDAFKKWLEIARFRE